METLTPESALKVYWKNVIQGAPSIAIRDNRDCHTEESFMWQSRLSLIVKYEAHCITELGEDFRTKFRQCVELRSFSRASVYSLMATTTCQVKYEILKYLSMEEDETDVIFKSPNRPNIFLEVLKRESTNVSSG